MENNTSNSDPSPTTHQISHIEEEKFIAIMKQVEGASLSNLTESHIAEVFRKHSL